MTYMCRKIPGDTDGRKGHQRLRNNNHPRHNEEKNGSAIAGVPGEKPKLTSDKLPDSLSKFPCIQL